MVPSERPQMSHRVTVTFFLLHKPNKSALKKELLIPQGASPP